MNMANTSAVYARIDTELKEKAESILSQPFELRFPSGKPTAVGSMTRDQLDAEIMKGSESMKFGKTYTADEVDAELRREFGI